MGKTLIERRKKPKHADSDSKEAQPKRVEIEDEHVKKCEMGELHFEQMWKPTSYTQLINTGSKLRIQLNSHASLKWKPAGDVCYLLQKAEFHTESQKKVCNMFKDKKYPLQLVFTFMFKYTCHIPHELIQHRINLHTKYEELESNTDNERTSILEQRASEVEDEYDDVEEYVLEQRYYHSSAKEALSQRKPTAFAFLSAKTKDKNEDGDDDMSVEGDKIEVNFDKQIKFKIEKEVHEEIARKFYPFYEEAKRKTAEENKNSKHGGKAYPEDSSNFVNEAFETLDPPNTVNDTESTPYNAVMFPTKKDQERERERRKRFNECLLKRKIEDQDKIIETMKSRKLGIQLNVVVMFEEVEKAPFYSLFSYVQSVQQPFSSLLVDRNLLVPFQKGVSSPDYYAFVGPEIASPDDGENIMWIVAKNPIPITKAQLENFNDMELLPSESKDLSRKTEPFLEITGEIHINEIKKKAEPITCPGKDLCVCELVDL